MDDDTRIEFQAVHRSLNETKTIFTDSMNEIKLMLTNHMSFEDGLNIASRMTEAERSIKDKVDTKRVELIEDCLEEKSSWKALYAGLTTVLLLGGLIVGIVEIVK